ncbi:piRNA biogenesis protein EXD1 [Gallus gallus]|uniref:Exonuclease 3'-5' domain containing 1 n=1 Tax=Gallus gallus TaxID=9031 RepID=A0A8V0ZVN0_CHICK|nr:piRNA biogenesis protein EXD1 [Gallus gallus]
MAFDFQRLQAALGMSVKLTLTCGVFQGVLHHINPSCDLLLLHTVKNLETGRSSPGVKAFFSREIVNVELLDEPDSQKRTAVLYECTSAVENKGADAGTVHGSLGCSPCASLEKELRALNSLNMNSFPGKEEEEKVEYTVIDCFQEKFGPAVLHLKQQDVISVVGEGVNLCPHGKLSWLQIATKSHVFLFDIFLLGPQAFRNGLQAVLEDKNILKVMHDCRWISDCLFHQYSVLLDNVFDTQVADVLQFSVATGGFFPHRTCTLQECLMQHLRIPSKWKTLMKCKQQMALENPDTWFLRPLPASLLQVLALKAMCLLLLHSSLMDNFMADLTAVVHAYLNTSQNRSEDHLGSMEPNCTELPKELRQLADIQKLRREKAVKEYRINEDGLLIRPVVELNDRNPQKDETL